MDKNIEKISVLDIFNNHYIVPIYQRSYAWGTDEIEQLIEDIESAIIDNNSSYFIGNLVVNKKEKDLFEVIDGQQRLTTLYLLQKYLKLALPSMTLSFEAREKSNRTLAYGCLDDVNTNEENLSEQILDGYRIISKYFKYKKIVPKTFIQKLESVFLVRIQVPKNIDLNHYFEIMNTRGEQLELHQIAKAKFLSVLKDKKSKEAATKIWESCSDMNSYVQMNFTPEIRNTIFLKDWIDLSPEFENFDSLKEGIFKDESSTYEKFTGNKTLISIIEDVSLKNKHGSERHEEKEENERFESIISFPNFLLQVNAALKSDKENDTTLSDHNFLYNLKSNWETPTNAKNFLFHLLKCRILFDRYIIKREFTDDYKDIGKWSLKYLKRYAYNKKSPTPEYLNTFGRYYTCITLQSCLRITYTSPKTMYWITLVLKELLGKKKALNNEGADITKLLEDYCRKKVKDSDYTNKSGFAFERIVFSYLDYVLYRDGYTINKKKLITPLQENWQFQFRNSIEHFYPQNPSENKKWDDDFLNHFGNLALITISGNSKFSNLLPPGKISTYPSVIEQSLKLKIMKLTTDICNDGWTKEKAEEHGEEMFKILKKDLGEEQ